jgi:hypothetical protein
MKLYTTGQGHWAGTQADARKLKKQHGVPCDMHEVPLNKKDFLAFLNGNTVTLHSKPVSQEAALDAMKTVEGLDEKQFLPASNAGFETDEGERDTQNYIGKTTVLAAGAGLGMGKFKLHIYFYTEGGSY